jgi:hypothetical protein
MIFDGGFTPPSSNKGSVQKTPPHAQDNTPRESDRLKSNNLKGKKMEQWETKIILASEQQSEVKKLCTASRFLAGSSTEIEKFCLFMKRLKFHP